MKLDSGALTFAGVERSYGRAGELAAGGRLDLSEVQRADSAGVALLLELARCARRRNARLALIDPPPQLRGLLAFFGIDHLFDIQKAEAT